MSASSAAAPFLVVAAGASRLADPVRRDALVAAASAAIEARTGAGRLVAEVVPGAVRILVPA